MKILKWVGGGLLALVIIAMLIPTPDASAPAEATNAPAPEPVVAAPDPTSDLTPAQRNAFRSANAYLQTMGFSRQGLIDQLSSEYGDQYSVADATAAVDKLQVDWSAQAARSAANYLSMTGFSCQGLIEQLSSAHGDKYTVEQATAGARSAGAC